MTPNEELKLIELLDHHSKYPDKDSKKEIIDWVRNLVPVSTPVSQTGAVYYYNYDGFLHCEHGPAILGTDGTKEWYIDGRRHRKGGPAIEWADGSKTWYQYGVLHRLDGPAVEYVNGNKAWYVYGEKYTEEEFNKNWAKKQ